MLCKYAASRWRFLVFIKLYANSTKPVQHDRREQTVCHFIKLFDSDAEDASSDNLRFFFLIPQLVLILFFLKNNIHESYDLPHSATVKLSTTLLVNVDG